MTRSRTADAVATLRAMMARRDARVVGLLVGVAYLLAYLFAVGDLVLRPGGGSSLFVVSDPFARALERTGPTSFERVALVEVWRARLLFSPVNALVGVSLGTLVGLNVALSYLSIRYPSDCGIGAGSGLLASVPALLSGTACCGPVVFLALGVQAGGALLTAFTWLLPLGAVALLATLAYLATRLDAAALAAA